ncbi:MAG: ATP-dependent RNA helicase HrpA [Gammaproteobacteria bacterium]|nr:ATP-dependent RNA helicase HrpA [Gammaproteobacteria bacterium]
MQKQKILLDSLKQKLDTCQLADVFQLRNALRKIERDNLPEKDLKSSATALNVAIEKSQRACDLRRAAIPVKIAYPENLPVSARAVEIVELLSQHQVLIVAGDTGSGKTTQLPKICLEAGFGIRGLIGHTQPRRLAALSVANRIADELGVEVGAGVGSQIRFKDNTSEQSFLKLMTDGILLAEIQQDKFLNKYEVLIIDEAHERSLNIDFLLGYLKQLLHKRKDLKLIITSATIDVEKFSTHFNNAPIVAVSGRTYPVETRYAPLVENSTEQIDDDLQIDGIIKAVEGIIKSDTQKGSSSGDILVFLSSEREIRATATKLRKQKYRDVEILPLYGRLRYSEQIKIFKPARGRKIVLATNVAETSITVPGINTVIDTGLARISRYSLQSKVQRLPIEAISQASANQRKGRCGRMADGVCIRLYAESDFDSRPEFTDPEVMRTNLASVILRMKHLRLGEIEQFPFLDAPESKAINEGMKLLIELDALSNSRQLTDSGRKMAVLPVDPRYARMLITASTQNCLRELQIVVSALSIQDPREISSENRQQAMQQLAEFNHEDSDFLSLVKLWDDYEKKRQDLNQGQLRKHCKKYFLSYMRMREWREVHHQLLLSCQKIGLRMNSEAGDYEAIHKCLISGSLNQIAKRLEGRNYRGNRNKTFSLFSTSVLASKGAKWIVSGEQIETSQTFATSAAKIQPEWIEEMALHLVKREYFEPHWSKKRQQVMAYEKVQLYGLVIIEKGLLSYSKIDPKTSRALFIQEGLIAGEVSTRLKVYQQNRELLASLAKQEEKMRRPDLLVADRDVAAFYEQRLPETVCSTRDLEAWVRKQGESAEKSLLMTIDNLIGSDDAMDVLHSFPDAAAVYKNNLRLDYVFEPGSKTDGATLEVPVEMVGQLQQADLDWAVPGNLAEKCTALIKGLPKSRRKNFIPVNAFVAEACQQMSSKDGDIIAALLSQIRNLKGLELDRQEFEQIELPAHLNTKIRVIQGSKKEIAFASSIREVREQLQQQGLLENGENSFVSGDAHHRHGVDSGYNHSLEGSGAKDWIFEDLPEQIEIGDSLKLIRFPALVDEGETVGVRLFSDKFLAQQKHKQGLVKLYQLRSIQQHNQLKKRFLRLADTLVLKAPFPLGQLTLDAALISYIAAFDLDDSMPRSKDEFEQRLNAGKSKVLTLTEKIESLFVEVINQHYEISRVLSTLKEGALAYVVEDIESQLDSLLHEGFLSETGLVWFTQYPRYLKAILMRLIKAPHMGDKDRLNTELLSQYQIRYRKLQAKAASNNKEELLRLRWMLEEFRVSVFAQKLGTHIPVSEKRLDKQIEKIL